MNQLRVVAKSVSTSEDDSQQEKRNRKLFSVGEGDILSLGAFRSSLLTHSAGYRYVILGFSLQSDYVLCANLNSLSEPEVAPGTWFW